MIYALIYGLGVVTALAVMRDPWPARIGTALAWPLGPLAFIVVAVILLLSAVFLWPVLMVGSAALIGALLWLALG